MYLKEKAGMLISIPITQLLLGKSDVDYKDSL